MTDSKTPEWVKEEALDLIRSVYPVVDEDERPYIPADELPTVSQALLSAYERGRKEGIEEAAKVADKREAICADAVAKIKAGELFGSIETALATEGCARLEAAHIARTIRQLLEVKG